MKDKLYRINLILEVYILSSLSHFNDDVSIWKCCSLEEATEIS